MVSHTQIGLHNVTAKDSFLKNKDLMTMTFSHLVQANVDYNEKWCLLNAALTCKDFKMVGSRGRRLRWIMQLEDLLLSLQKLQLEVYRNLNKFHCFNPNFQYSIK